MVQVLKRRQWIVNAKLFLLMALSIPCKGQSFPGLQLIRPDSNTGRPLLVASPCASPSEPGDQAWVPAILVYEDSLMDISVDKSCIIAAVQIGFGQTGKYMVALYSHFKDSEYPCKHLYGKEIRSNPVFQRECKMIGYRMRWVDVDTRNKKMHVSQAVALDIEGFHIVTQEGGKDWTQFAELEKDPDTRPTLTAIGRSTKLVEKELEYWNYKYKRN